MNRETLIQTVSRISELRAEIGRLSELQKELKRLEALIDGIEGIEAGPRSPSKAPSRGSLAELAAQLLDENPTRDWSAEEVAERLDAKVPSTRAAFSKLRKAERIVDTRRGRVRSAKTQNVEAISDRAA
jgi:hypothetical protein